MTKLNIMRKLQEKTLIQVPTIVKKYKYLNIYIEPTLFIY